MSLILAVEGIDASGKSTAFTRLAEKIGAVTYSTPPAEHLSRRHEMDANASDWDHYQFYLKGIQIASRELEVLARTGRPIVIDRYWPTTVAYHRAMGVDAKLSDFGPILMLDFILYFEVRPEIQAERFKKRGMTAGDHRMENRMGRTKEEYEALLLTEPHIRVDTSDLTPEEVVAELLRQLPLVKR